jgi:hypothetical protein
VTWALLRKELREHGVVLIGLFALSAVGFVAAAHEAADSGSAFVALRQFAIGGGLLTSLVVNHRLVVREYSGRTQLFLEILPITRRRVVSVKYLLGAALVTVPVAMALASSAFAAARFEPLTPRYVGIVGARAIAFALILHALAFLAAFLGRFRVGLWMALLLGSFTLDLKGLDTAQLPLSRLVGERMPFERHVVPWGDLGLAAVAVAVLVAAAFALALARDGSVAAQLARRMRPREKVFFACAGLGYLFVLFLLEDHRVRPRFDLSQTVRQTVGETIVGVSPGEGLDEAKATSLGLVLAEDLDDLRRWLALKEMPAVFVLPRRGLDPEVFLRARLSNTDGVVIQAALADPALDVRELRAFVVGQVVAWHGRNRAFREPRRLLLDGLARYWLDRAQPDPEAREGPRAALALSSVDASSLGRWLSTRERLGPCVADALAGRLLHVIARRLGPARFQVLLREALGGRPPDDARALLGERDVGALLLAHGVPGLEVLLSELRAELGPDVSEEVSRIARMSPSARAHRVTNTDFDIHVSLVGEGGEPVTFALYHAELGPWTGELDREDLARFDAAGEGILPATFSAGARLFTAFEVRQPALRCSVRLGATRWEVR